MRRVYLDTETTSLSIHADIIEIGIIEAIDKKVTGRYIHRYFNTKQFVEKGATAIHGLTNEFLSQYSYWSKQDLIDILSFIDNAEIVIHNSPYDGSLIGRQMIIQGYSCGFLSRFCNRITDTIVLARSLVTSKSYSLDNLCLLLNIDKSARAEFHGALIDSEILLRLHHKLMEYSSYIPIIKEEECSFFSLEDQTFMMKNKPTIHYQNTKGSTSDDRL
jgi:DNA polymerase-3 subunit epsilon